jgi:hypothetical protein
MLMHNMWPWIVVVLSSISIYSVNSASSSSALASSIKFKIPKIDKDKVINSRKSNLGVDNDPDVDDDGSKFDNLFNVRYSNLVTRLVNAHDR